MTEATPDAWWRADVYRYSVADEYGDHSHTTTRVEFTPYAVARYTPKGVWLREPFGQEFFVLGNALRQRATPTREAALEDCRQRKICHVRGCRARLAAAEEDLRLIERTKP